MTRACLLAAAAANEHIADRPAAEHGPNRARARGEDVTEGVADRAAAYHGAKWPHGDNSANCRADRSRVLGRAATVIRADWAQLTSAALAVIGGVGTRTDEAGDDAKAKCRENKPDNTLHFQPLFSARER